MEYIRKEEANITLKTKIRFDGNNYNIYDIRLTYDKVCFFSLKINIKFIIYFNNGKLYCVNLYNDNIVEAQEYMKTINFDEIVFTESPLKIKRNKYLHSCCINSLPCLIAYCDFQYCNFSNNLNLTNAQSILDKLNIQLKEKCPEYTLGLDYLYNITNPNSTLPIEVIVFNPIFNPTDLILYIFFSNSFISSIVLKYEPENKTISIDSKTHDQYLNKKLNTILSSVIIILSKSIYPDSIFLSAEAINPILAYTMLKYFDAFNSDFNAFNEKIKKKEEKEAEEKEAEEKKIDLKNKNLFNNVTLFMEKSKTNTLELTVSLDSPIIIDKAKSVFDSIILSGLICKTELDLKSEQAEEGRPAAPAAAPEPAPAPAQEPPSQEQPAQEPPAQEPPAPPAPPAPAPTLAPAPPAQPPAAQPDPKTDPTRESKTTTEGGKRSLTKKKKKKKSKRVKSIKKK